MAQLVKNLHAMQADLGQIPGLGRFPGEGKDYQLQYCGLENSMDCIIQGVAKSRTRLSDFHFPDLRFYCYVLSPKNCFCCVPLVLDHRVYTFIGL